MRTTLTTIGLGLLLGVTGCATSDMGVAQRYSEPAPDPEQVWLSSLTWDATRNTVPGSEMVSLDWSSKRSGPNESLVELAGGAIWLDPIYTSHRISLTLVVRVADDQQETPLPQRVALVTGDDRLPARITPAGTTDEALLAWRRGVTGRDWVGRMMVIALPQNAERATAVEVTYGNGERVILPVREPAKVSI